MQLMSRNRNPTREGCNSSSSGICLCFNVFLEGIFFHFELGPQKSTLEAEILSRNAKETWLLFPFHFPFSKFVFFYYKFEVNELLI